MLGNGGLYSFNLDRRVGERWVLRAGISDWSIMDWTGHETSLNSVPLLASKLFGTGSRRFELGGGILVGRRTQVGGQSGEPEDERVLASLTGLAGYRVQPVGGGLMFRISVAPFLGLVGGEEAYLDWGLWPSVGVSIGYAF